MIKNVEISSLAFLKKIVKIFENESFSLNKNIVRQSGQRSEPAPGTLLISEHLLTHLMSLIYATEIRPDFFFLSTSFLVGIAPILSPYFCKILVQK